MKLQEKVQTNIIYTDHKYLIVHKVRRSGKWSAKYWENLFIWPEIQYLLRNCEAVGLVHFKDPKAFTEDSNNMKDVYNSIEAYKQKEAKCIDSIWWYDYWYYRNKKLYPVVTEFFIWAGQLNIFLVFIT